MTTSLASALRQNLTSQLLQPCPISRHRQWFTKQTRLYSVQAPQTSANPTKRTHFRVTLYRSPIGLPQPQHDSLASLGLRKRMDVSYHRHSPDAAGLILSVKELLKVENVTDAEAEMGRTSSRKLVADDRGYRLIRNVLERE